MTHPKLSSEQIESSPYLSDIVRQYGEDQSIKTLNDSVGMADSSSLLALKAQFSLAIATTEFASFDEMGKVWSQFADSTIDRALELAWRQTAKRHKLKLPEGPVPGLFIIGLGKLGGRDLNFSSDIDLIAFFEPDVLPIPAHLGQAYVASDICKRLTQILQPRNSPEFVWRVDWRLRPESSGTGLAISTTKAETFYFFRSLPWHRLALMKARVVGGDKAAGKRFLDRLEPYIWRRNLDFTTLDELAALKTRINNEHPGLEYERSSPDPITPIASGFNVKLGRGGIREIEFIANAQQLIHGGKRPGLRVSNTRTALMNLSETKLLTETEVKTLREDYVVFRRLENAIQMHRNEQMHIVPDGADLEACLSLYGEKNDFHEDIFMRRQRVHLKFSKLFEGPAPSSETVSISMLEGQTARIAQSWKSGFLDHGVSANHKSKYSDLGRRLIKRVIKLNNSDAFERVDNFLKQIGRSEQYFSLLDHHPELLDKLITPLLHSPHMSEILRQSPHIIDIFIASETDDLKEESQFVLTSQDYENRLEALRRFVNEQLFRAYTNFLDGTFSAIKMQSRLTALAERTLELSIQIACDDLGLNNIPVTVLGLGKMGSRSMSPQSDLDLVFLFANDVDTELSTKIVQRLRTTLTVKLREGIAYELDMRLRPSGRSGPPAVKLSAFYDHHMQRAHSWEHIALAPARIVAGDRELGAEVENILEKIFARPRDIPAFKKDALFMFNRLKSERLEETSVKIWKSKLRRGGLMEADYIRSCLKLSGSSISKDLEVAIADWNKLQIWERLLGLTAKPITETPARYSNAIGVKGLAGRQKTLEKTILSITEAFFADIHHDPNRPARPIVWKN